MLYWPYFGFKLVINFLLIIKCIFTNHCNWVLRIDRTRSMHLFMSLTVIKFLSVGSLILDGFNIKLPVKWVHFVFVVSLDVFEIKFLILGSGHWWDICWICLENVLEMLIVVILRPWRVILNIDICKTKYLILLHSRYLKWILRMLIFAMIFIQAMMKQILIKSHLSRLLSYRIYILRVTRHIHLLGGQIIIMIILREMHLILIDGIEEFGAVTLKNLRIGLLLGLVRVAHLTRYRWQVWWRLIISHELIIL